MRFLGKWWRFPVPRTLMVLLILASAMLLLLLQHGKLWRPSRGGAGQEGLGGKSAVDVTKDFLRIEADQVHHLRIMEEECQKHSGTGDIGRSMQELSPGRRQLLFRHLLVNDRYGFLYCYVPKVACSNWKRVIKVLSGSLPNVDVNVKMDHKKDLVFLSSFSPTEREYRLQHYYKFMFSREPLERLVSAYRNKLLEIPTFKQRYAPHIRRHWDQHYASKRNKRDVPLKELEKLQTLAENDKMHTNINVKSKLRPKAFAAGDHNSFHRASSHVGHSKANKTISDLHRATSRYRAGYMIPAEQSILEKPLSALHTGTNNIRSRYHISSPLNSHLIGEPVDNKSSNLNLHQDPLNSPSLEDHPRFPRELVNQLTKPERDRASTPEVSFTQFLAYITDLIPAKHDEHWMSASMLCQPCAVRYNFLGHHVGLPEEADWVLQHVKAPTDVRFPKRQTWYKPVSAASAADEATRVPRAILRKALQMYAADYYLFGYNSSILHHWMV